MKQTRKVFGIIAVIVGVMLLASMPTLRGHRKIIYRNFLLSVGASLGNTE